MIGRDPIAFEFAAAAAGKRSMSKTKNGIYDSKYKTASICKLQTQRKRRYKKDFRKIFYYNKRITQIDRKTQLLKISPDK